MAPQEAQVHFNINLLFFWSFHTFHYLENDQLAFFFPLTQDDFSMIEYDYIFHQNSSFCFYSLCSKTGIHMVPIFRIISDRPCLLFQSNCDGIFDSGGLSIVWEELNVRFCLRYIITGLTGIDWWNIVMYSICRMIGYLWLDFNPKHWQCYS